MKNLNREKNELLKAEELNYLAKYEESNHIIESILNSFIQSYDWENSLKALNLWSYNLCLLEKHEEAKNIFERTLKVIEERKVEYSLQIVKYYNYLGFWYYSKQRPSEAIEQHKKALSLLINFAETEKLEIAKCYQYIGTCSGDIGLINKGIDNIERSLSVAIKILGEMHQENAGAYNSLGLLYLYKGKYEVALSYFEKSIDICLKSKGVYYKDRVNGFMNLALYYFYIGDFKKSINIVNEKVLSCQNDKMHSKISNAYNILGINYHRLGKYDKAINYFKKAFLICLEKLGEKSLFGITFLINIAYNHLLNGDVQKAIEYNKRALETNSKFYPKHVNASVICNNIGECYLQNKDYEQAFVYAEMAFNYQKDKPNSGIKGSVVRDLGNCYFKTGNSIKAIECFKEASQIYSESVGANHPYNIEVSNKIGLAFLEINKSDEAIKIYEKTIENNCQEFIFSSNYQLPNETNFYSKNLLIDSCQGLAQAYNQSYKEKFQEPKKLIFSYYLYFFAIELSSEVKNNLQSENDILIFVKKNIFLCQRAVETGILISNLDFNNDMIQFSIEEIKETNSHFIFPEIKEVNIDLFMLSEKYKSSILHSKLLEQEAKIKVPKDIIDEEYQLRVDMNYLQNKINKKKDVLEKEALIWETERGKLEERYSNLISNLETNYSNYFDIKYNTQVVSTELFNVLNEKQILLEYLLTSEAIFIFVINQQTIEIKQIELPDDFGQFIDSFSILNKQNFIDDSRKAYEILIEPIEALLIDKNDIIIIKDPCIESIPFEVLLFEPVNGRPQTKELPYMIKRYTISYHFSATMWFKSVNKKKRNQKSSFIGYAPRYENSNFTPLVSTNKEVLTIAEAFKCNGKRGDAQIGKIATLDNFISQIENYQYILFAGHGFYDSNKSNLSGIVFSSTNDENQEYILYISDAYNLNLNADLVVLSCCESGLGKVALGEGILGINRGFLYSGANNIIYTLFKVPDENSHLLIQYFFDEVIKGNSFKNALPKLKLIQQDEIEPINWAGYVFLG